MPLSVAHRCIAEHRAPERQVDLIGPSGDARSAPPERRRDPPAHRAYAPPSEMASASGILLWSPTPYVSASPSGDRCREHRPRSEPRRLGDHRGQPGGLVQESVRNTAVGPPCRTTQSSTPSGRNACHPASPMRSPDPYAPATALRGYRAVGPGSTRDRSISARSGPRAVVKRGRRRCPPGARASVVLVYPDLNRRRSCAT